MASARFESSEEVGEPPDHQEDPEVDLDEIQVCKNIRMSFLSLLFLEGVREIELKWRHHQFHGEQADTG